MSQQRTRGQSFLNLTLFATVILSAGLQNRVWGDDVPQQGADQATEVDAGPLFDLRLLEEPARPVSVRSAIKAFDTARSAALKGDAEVSFQAVRKALDGGLPIGNPEDRRMRMMAMMLRGVDAAPLLRPSPLVERNLFHLNQHWRRKKFPADQIAKTLAVIVLRPERVYIDGLYLPQDRPPTVFAKSLEEEPADFAFAQPTPGVTSTAYMLVAAAKSAGKLDELADAVQELVNRETPNADVLAILVEIARGESDSLNALVERYIAKMLGQGIPLEGGRESPISIVEYLVTRACLEHPATREQGRYLAEILLSQANRFRDEDVMLQLRHAVAMSSVAEEDGREDQYVYRTGLELWRPGTPSWFRVGSRIGAPPVWVDI